MMRSQNEMDIEEEEWARHLASDIDAILHAGQRAEARFDKIVPRIRQTIVLARQAGHDDAISDLIKPPS